MMSKLLASAERGGKGDKALSKLLRSVLDGVEALQREKKLTHVFSVLNGALGMAPVKSMHVALLLLNFLVGLMTELGHLGDVDEYVRERDPVYSHLKEDIGGAAGTARNVFRIALTIEEGGIDDDDATDLRDSVYRIPSSDIMNTALNWDSAEIISLCITALEALERSKMAECLSYSSYMCRVAQVRNFSALEVEALFALESLSLKELTAMDVVETPAWTDNIEEKCPTTVLSVLYLRPDLLDVLKAVLVLHPKLEGSSCLLAKAVKATESFPPTTAKALYLVWNAPSFCFEEAATAWIQVVKTSAVGGVMDEHTAVCATRALLTTWLVEGE
uniref:Uncharacterized protein n=1 Tax=Palpitomonas bilix TaxID=652834 RepID=A0A7S3GGU0_9EUKA